MRSCCGGDLDERDAMVSDTLRALRSEESPIVGVDLETGKIKYATDTHAVSNEESPRAKGDVLLPNG